MRRSIRALIPNLSSSLEFRIQALMYSVECSPFYFFMMRKGLLFIIKIESVYRNNCRMRELCCDLRFAHKAFPVCRLWCCSLEHRFDGDFSVEQRLFGRVYVPSHLLPRHLWVHAFFDMVLALLSVLLCRSYRQTRGLPFAFQVLFRHHKYNILR